MKLFETLFEKTLGRSPLLVKTVNVLEALADEVHKLSVETMMLAHQINVHQQALQELYARQGLVMRAIKSSSLDMQLPDPRDKEKAKPN